ncbi:MAG: hypothetical protein M3P10_08750 [Actinomycetota bacterium]|nr:hypothetical protein [Actinomycetota bacterium]
MSDLESSVLAAVLGFARSRLDQLLKKLATDAETLLISVLPDATTAERALAAGTTATAHLVTARGHLDQLTTDLAAEPNSLGEVQTAFAEFAAALGEIDAALRAINAGVPGFPPAEQAVLTVVRKAVSSGGAGVSGLLSQLGLGALGSISQGLSASGTTISLQLANPAPRSIGGAAQGLTVSGTTLKANVDYGTQAALGLTLATDLAVGLAADGFVEELLGGDASATTNLKISIDTSHGLRFQSGTKMRADLPGSLAVPGIQLRGLGVEIPAHRPFSLMLTGTIAGSLGPISAIVQGAGIALSIDPAQIGSGAAPVSLTLEAPTGVGLSVDAGVIHGGGFLTQRNGEYGGALDLSLGPIDITATGLLGTDPFSLVLVLSVRFTPAIQLSFGFTLNAVGGLLALERTVSTDALRAGIHDHTADTMLFPKDPVAAAPTILELLRGMFPTQAGGFVAGPLLELGWGAPISFVTARIGVVIALPDPKVLLIGSLRVALPAPEAPIVDIRADLYGEITPDHLLFLVSLSGSKVAGFSIAGDFGVLIAWGDDPNLAFSAGGFHPHYSPPGELAGMRRVSVDISPPSFLTLRADAYLALTSNSFQLGARVELHAEVAGVDAEGHLQFDALVLWAPTFHFEIELTAGVSLYAFGESFATVDLHLRLEGPGPWVAQGSASVSVLFFDVDLDIPRISWGEGENQPRTPVHPQKMVRDELSKPAAWEARLPADADALVRLIPVVDAGATVVHPLGALEARQRIVPLETVIERIGANPVEVPRVNLGPPLVGGQGAKAVSAVTDLFAPGEFLTLTDDQKLSRPAFEPFPSGIVIAAETALYGTPSSVPYQWFTICPPSPTRTRGPLISLIAIHAALLATGPAGKAVAIAGNPYAVEAEPVALADAGAAKVRTVRDLSPVPGVTDGPMTTVAAAHLVAQLGEMAQWVGAGIGA